MKYTLLLCSIFVFTQAFAQDSLGIKVYDDKKMAEGRIKDRKYLTSMGWTINEGDEIKLGKGSMPDKTFAFITENPNALTYNSYTDYSKRKLQHTYNGRVAKIAQLYVIGNKKSGFYIVATIKVGQLSRYLLDIENAIEAAEIEVPAEYVKKATTPVHAASITSMADELKKLKELLDNGALTREEYEAAKKKILNQ